LRDAEPTVTVLGHGEPPLPAGDPATLRRVVQAHEYDEWLAGHAPDDPGVEPAPGDPAVIFYTSGTTGLPKGIVLSGGSISQALATMHYEMGLDTTSVAMAPIPYFHISGFGLALVANLNGAALLLETETDRAPSSTCWYAAGSRTPPWSPRSSSGWSTTRTRPARTGRH
jgi:acyl-CoA synthetase (AMP-forming)/AMP-acid ligase II